MAKSKNHTNHNQNKKDHKNGIKKPPRQYNISTRGMNKRYLRTLRKMRKLHLAKHLEVLKAKRALQRAEWFKKMRVQFPTQFNRHTPVPLKITEYVIADAPHEERFSKKTYAEKSVKTALRPHILKNRKLWRKKLRNLNYQRWKNREAVKLRKPGHLLKKMPKTVKERKQFMQPSKKRWFQKRDAMKKDQKTIVVKDQKKGVQKKGVQKGVQKKGVQKKGVQKKGVQKKGVQKKGEKKSQKEKPKEKTKKQKTEQPKKKNATPKKEKTEKPKDKEKPKAAKKEKPKAEKKEKPKAEKKEKPKKKETPK